MFERAKAHVRSNKDRYICGGVGLVAGATAVLLFRRCPSQIITISDACSPNVAGRDLSINITKNITNNIHRLSYIVRNANTGEVFKTQREAAESVGVTAKNMSQYLNGKTTLPEGMAFERLGIAV